VRVVLVVVVAMKLVVAGVDLETVVELSPAAKAEAAAFSPYSSPSTAVLLRRRVVAWYGCLSSSFQSLHVLLIGSSVGAGPRRPGVRRRSAFVSPTEASICTR